MTPQSLTSATVLDPLYFAELRIILSSCSANRVAETVTDYTLTLDYAFGLKYLYCW